MVRRTLYDPDKAAEWVEEAGDRLGRFETDRKDVHKCESLADALERALKAIIVAGGERVAHRHELDELWKQAEKIGGKLPGDIDETDLKQLTRYTGEFLYPAQGARELDPRGTRERFEDPVRAVVKAAEERVPLLVKDTLARIRTNPERARADDPDHGTESRNLSPVRDADVGSAPRVRAGQPRTRGEPGADGEARRVTGGIPRGPAGSRRGLTSNGYSQQAG